MIMASKAQMRISGVAMAINAAWLAARCASGLKRSISGFTEVAVWFSGPFQPARAGMNFVSGFCTSFKICFGVGLMGVAINAAGRIARTRKRSRIR